ncbi:hypothetical protein AOLI_G00143100 [Acnodon oligacanthus]
MSHTFDSSQETLKDSLCPLFAGLTPGLAPSVVLLLSHCGPCSDCVVFQSSAAALSSGPDSDWPFILPPSDTAALAFVL